MSCHSAPNLQIHTKHKVLFPPLLPLQFFPLTKKFRLFAQKTEDAGIKWSDDGCMSLSFPTHKKAAYVLRRTPATKIALIEWN